MNEADLRAYCAKILAERDAFAEQAAKLEDGMLSLYHPEFGSAWLEGGEIAIAIHSARAQAFDEVLRYIAPEEGTVEKCSTEVAILRRMLRQNSTKEHLLSQRTKTKKLFAGAGAVNSEKSAKASA